MAGSLEKLNQKRRSMGSGIFEVSISDLAASAKKVYGFEDLPEAKKFLPMNFLRIMNYGGTDLKVYVGQGSYGEKIPDNTIWTYTGNFYSFVLENLDTSDTATGASITVTAEKKPLGGA